MFLLKARRTPGWNAAWQHPTIKLSKCLFSMELQLRLRICRVLVGAFVHGALCPHHAKPESSSVIESKTFTTASRDGSRTSRGQTT